MKKPGNAVFTTFPGSSQEIGVTGFEPSPTVKKWLKKEVFDDHLSKVPHILPHKGETGQVTHPFQGQITHPRRPHKLPGFLRLNTGPVNLLPQS